MSFYSVWGTGPGDVYAFGDDVFACGRSCRTDSAVVLHYDGANWQGTLTRAPMASRPGEPRVQIFSSSDGAAISSTMTVRAGGARTAERRTRSSPSQAPRRGTSGRSPRAASCCTAHG